MESVGCNIVGTSEWSAPWNFTTTSITVVQGLIGFWKFDEGRGITISDDSCGGNHGACINFPSWATGVNGYALVLNGLDQCAWVSDSLSLNITNEITLAAWVRPGKKSSQKIIVKGNPEMADGYELSLLSTGKASFRINQHTSDVYKINSVTQYPITGAWIHIAATFNTTEMKIFINGMKDKSLTFSVPVSIGSNALPLVIGEATDETSNFQGSIDEVRIYNYALQANEILTLASSSAENTSVRARVQSENTKINNEEDILNEMSVFPNPADNTLFLGLAPGKKISSQFPTLADIFSTTPCVPERIMK